MYNEQFIGEIQSIKGANKNEILSDGTKTKTPIHIIKLACASIDYEAIGKFNPNISATLLNIQPMPFTSVNFGDQSAFNMDLELKPEETDTESKTYSKVLIKNLTVKIKENIPVYYFIIEISGDQSSKFITDNLKSRISFEFSKV